MQNDRLYVNVNVCFDRRACGVKPSSKASLIRKGHRIHAIKPPRYRPERARFPSTPASSKHSRPCLERGLSHIHRIRSRASLSQTSTRHCPERARFPSTLERVALQERPRHCPAGPEHHRIHASLSLPLPEHRRRSRIASRPVIRTYSQLDLAVHDEIDSAIGIAPGHVQRALGDRPVEPHVHELF